MDGCLFILGVVIFKPLAFEENDHYDENLPKNAK
jgi:hypothetical protein